MRITTRDRKYIKYSQYMIQMAIYKFMNIAMTLMSNCLVIMFPKDFVIRLVCDPCESCKNEH